MSNPYTRRHVQGRSQPRLEHILIAERAVGHALPSGARVHHVNGQKKDNRPTNLVVCPSEAYHKLLHRRADALDATGHADWLKCGFCKQYDAPENLAVKQRKVNGATVPLVYHRACNNAAAVAYRKRTAYEAR